VVCHKPAHTNGTLLTAFCFQECKKSFNFDNLLHHHSFLIPLVVDADNGGNIFFRNILSRPSSGVTYKGVVRTGNWICFSYNHNTLQSPEITLTASHLNLNSSVTCFEWNSWFFRGRLQLVHSKLQLSSIPELKLLRKYRKGKTHFHKFCFFSLCVTVDMCLNKPVTREFPYLLLGEHRITDSRHAEPLPQKRLSLLP
jgi:hypothetical protein